MINLPNENDYARLAAILDGEGYVGYRNACGNPAPNIEVTMTHRETLEQLQVIFGGNLSKPRAQHSAYAKECSRWTMNTTAMRLHLPKALPFSITKQAQIHLVIEWLNLRAISSSTYKHDKQRQEGICQELKRLNQRGATL